MPWARSSEALSERCSAAWTGPVKACCSEVAMELEWAWSSGRSMATRWEALKELDWVGLTVAATEEDSVVDSGAGSE